MKRFGLAFLGLVGYAYDHLTRSRALRYAAERSSYFYGTHPDLKAFEAEMDRWYA
jgi:hypothetical protein